MTLNPFPGGLCPTCGGNHNSTKCPKTAVNESMQQMESMNLLIQQRDSKNEEEKVCVCGRTNSSGCFSSRCDFPGWHG